MADFNQGDVVRLGCVQEYDGSEDIVNVLHVVLQDATFLDFAAAAQDFAEYCGTLFNTFKTGLSDLMVPKHISIKNITRDTVWGNIAWSLYTGGTDTNDSTAPQVALLVWGRTSISRVQIRKYLGVCCEGNMTDGVWSAGIRSVALNFIDYHITNQTMTNGLVLRGCAYNATLPRITYAVSGTTTSNPVIQRRRRRGRGG